jgi:hypothetical protein
MHRFAAIHAMESPDDRINVDHGSSREVDVGTPSPRRPSSLIALPRGMISWASSGKGRKPGTSDSCGGWRAPWRRRQETRAHTGRSPRAGEATDCRQRQNCSQPSLTSNRAIGEWPPSSVTCCLRACARPAGSSRARDRDGGRHVPEPAPGKRAKSERAHHAYGALRRSVAAEAHRRSLRGRSLEQGLHKMPVR